MGASALFHAFYVKNEKYQTYISRLDYGGISILIFASSFPVCYYAMACPQIDGKKSAHNNMQHYPITKPVYNFYFLFICSR